MAEDVHYEVFLKKNEKSGWALHGACKERDESIKVAHSLLAQHKSGSVRVSKEYFNNGERTFRSVPIFEGGAEAFGKVKDKTGDAALPCFAPDDLSKGHARDTIRRSLTGWFERQQALPMELLHSADLVEKLEASGTELQHAVQKVAVASAQDSDANVQTVVKQLNDLVQLSLNRIYKDAREDRLKTYPKGKDFAEVAAEIHNSDARGYALRAAMADRLKSSKKYGDKLETLLEMADTLPVDDKAREFAHNEVDAYLTDLIGFDAGREALLGKCNDLGETVIRLTCLYDGDHGAEALGMAPRSAKRMAQKISDGDLGESRTAIAQILLRELEKPKRLRPSSIREEIRLARDLAQKLVMSADAALPADRLIKAFTARSSRLLQPEAIDELLRFARDPNEEIELLLGLEENLVGEGNKSKLAGYVRSTLGANKTETHFVRGPGKPLEALSQLTAHQARVLRGSYPERDKNELAAALDQLGLKILDTTNILCAVEKGPRPALDRAQALLKLAQAGALPKGECLRDAQARAMRLLKSEMGLKEAQSPDGRPKVQQIQQLMSQLNTAA